MTLPACGAYLTKLAILWNNPFCPTALHTLVWSIYTHQGTYCTFSRAQAYGSIIKYEVHAKPVRNIDCLGPLLVVMAYSPFQRCVFFFVPFITSVRLGLDHGRVTTSRTVFDMFHSLSWPQKYWWLIIQFIALTMLTVMLFKNAFMWTSYVTALFTCFVRTWKKRQHVQNVNSSACEYNNIQEGYYIVNPEITEDKCLFQPFDLCCHLLHH